MKKRKEKRKYVARPGIVPRTPDLRVRCPTDCATRPSDLFSPHRVLQEPSSQATGIPYVLMADGLLADQISHSANTWLRQMFPLARLILVLFLYLFIFDKSVDVLQNTVQPKLRMIIKDNDKLIRYCSCTPCLVNLYCNHDIYRVVENIHLTKLNFII